MTDAEEGWCHICHSIQGVRLETDPQKIGANAEDAQSPADYYLVNNHINKRTGLKCDGVDKVPESLYIPDEGPDCDDPPDDEIDPLVNNWSP